MKRTWKALLLLSVMSVQWESAFALLELPSSLNTSTGYEGGTLAPANTGSSFFQNLLKKINFGGSFGNTSTQNTQTSQYNTTTQNQNTTNTGSTFSPSTVQTSSYDEEYQKILKQNLGGLPSVTTAGGSKNSGGDITIPTLNSLTTQNQTYLTQDEIAKKFEKFILDVNKLRSGYIATPTQVASSQQNTSVPQQTNNMTPQQQQQLQSFLMQNSMPMNGYSNCGYLNSAQEKQTCINNTRIACQQGFLGGELLMPECSQLPINTYAGMTYGSQPSYSLDNFINHNSYYSRAEKSLDFLPQSFPQQYFNKEGNYAGPNWNIIGNATHYACTKRSGVYYPDNFLISTYRYVTAFGYKARYGTNVGDSNNSCNFNYCGVAVPLQLINSAYGGKANAKNQLIQITNTANLKCTVAPIQDISAVKTFTHTGSNAVIDLSLCVMEKLNGGAANSGSIRVQYRPLRKGEVGCNMSVQSSIK